MVKGQAMATITMGMSNTTMRTSTPLRLGRPASRWPSPSRLMTRGMCMAPIAITGTIMATDMCMAPAAATTTDRVSCH